MANKKLNVLAVDDDKDLLFLINIWLKENFNVQTAIDGNDCLKKLDKKINLILLDIMMPGPKPNELIRIIKEKSPQAYVIYLTNLDVFNITPEQEKKEWKPILKPPIIGYINKPVDKTGLLKKIEEVFKIKKFLK